MKIQIGSTLKTGIGIISLTVLEVVALKNGIDGTLLAAVIAAIAAMCGYHIKNIEEYFKD